MSNNYYSRTSNPQSNSAGSSSLIRAEFALLEAGFDKLPTLTANGDEVVVVNAGATALETVPRATLIDTTVVAATSKTTPVDADLIPLVDSAASNVLKKLTWANVKATLLTWLQGTVLPAPGPIGGTTPSTGAFTTLSATGAITSTIGNDALVLSDTSATTGFKGLRLRNTTGGIDVGVQNNAGTWVSGATANDGVVVGKTGISFSANDGAATQMRLSSIGLAVTGAASTTGDVTVGAAAAATNRFININGVVNKAGGIAFQESGSTKWLVGNGAASENGNFEIYDAASGNNFVFTRTGNFSVMGSVTIGSFTTATKPAHAAGKMIYVSDGGGGAVFQGSNGSAWVNLG